ncbi:serine hydrolase domain-containing protein [Cellulomonas dongxiuzhuiae]|uniref:Beta-lactamase family protein n=1 Tax=Cellulomonas dongxiuzhuiae TaxID=2819979 RepID=A0ABX8GID0_9CELL|nr:serine hydrolase domain-containing protein [Cellulomonas dongxiuzhuiae]MBO3094939.1 beta-lactamase family protein [Cellulomonas dongxiuzhuiae]QWC15959.1 beta-lactamase family protein [Cellulomonas dongxiuzhuiae]
MGDDVVLLQVADEAVGEVARDADEHVGLVARVVRGTPGALPGDGAPEVLLDAAWGLADRRHGLPMTPRHRFGTASGCKGFTALAVLALVADGRLDLTTTARSLLRDDLPLIADDVTVEQLLSHRSGIGEYFDDDADVSDYLLPVPVHTLVDPEDYLPILDGHPQVFAPGTDFAYCNGGFVVLSILAQRASGVPFHELVRTRVLEPAGMSSTGYPRSDALPDDAAIGYVHVDGQWRSNVHHLPVVGGGDGGAYTTTLDMERFWGALLGGRIVPDELVARMRRAPGGDGGPADGETYGLGLWLRDSGSVTLEGEDSGVSFWSTHEPATGLTWTVAGSTSAAAWPVVRALRDALAG